MGQFQGAAAGEGRCNPMVQESAGPGGRGDMDLGGLLQTLGLYVCVWGGVLNNMTLVP